jgi:glycosyltransferase involved in cell wall biosynthesis
MYLDYLSLFDTYDLVTYLNEGNIRQSVKSHLKTILAHLVKKNGYKFIIASNYDYIECVELPSVCKTLNIPYIILYKEGLNLNTGVATTYTVKNNSVFPFLGDKILTYNQSVRDAFVNSNNHSVAPEKVIACGVPRFDEIIRSENNDTEDTYEAVLFSSYPIDKIGLYKNQHKNTIKKYIDSFHMDFIKLATKMPTKKFLIKTKAAEYYFSYVKKMVDVHGTLPNLTITNHGNAQEYIAKSEVICGFNSTTLIESCLMKKTTVSMKIPNITSSEEENLLKLNLNTHFWDKPGWFENFFMDKNSKTSNKSNNPIDKQYRNLIFSLDGNSSLRVESEILKEVSKFQ